jgi:hypothetical protein
MTHTVQHGQFDQFLLNPANLESMYDSKLLQPVINEVHACSLPDMASKLLDFLLTRAQRKFRTECCEAAKKHGQFRLTRSSDLLNSCPWKCGNLGWGLGFSCEDYADLEPSITLKLLLPKILARGICK